MIKNLTVEHEWQRYLRLMGLNESTLSSIQKTETKRAFYGGFGQAILLLRDELPEDEDEGVVVLESLHSEIGVFWNKEMEKVHGKYS